MSQSIYFLFSEDAENANKVEALQACLFLGEGQVAP